MIVKTIFQTPQYKLLNTNEGQGIEIENWSILTSKKNILNSEELEEYELFFFCKQF